jgi:hypothetical protein
MKIRPVQLRSWHEGWYEWRLRPADHDHDYQPDPLGGDHTCVILGCPLNLVQMK